MKKKTKIVIGLIALALILMVPIPVHYKDGGTVSYNAVLYSVTKVHSIADRTGADGKFEMGYEVGTKIRVLAFEVYNDVREVFEQE